ncbi:MAG: tripartite tricarboxylate transporter substrate-binding protein [Candidatus Binatia bacterium]
MHKFRKWPLSGVRLLTLAAVALTAVNARAAQVKGELDPNYFKGKTFRVVINYEPGSSADLFGRMIAKHLAKFLPGEPRMLVVNRPGASGTVGANYLYGARGDGLTIGMFSALYPSNQITFPDVQFNMLKFRPLASIQGRNQLWFIRGSAPYDRVQQAVGQSSAGGPKFTYAEEALCGANSVREKLVKEWLDLPMDIKYGLPGGRRAAMQQLERGDIDSVQQSMWYTLPKDRPDWLKKGFLEVFANASPPGEGDFQNNGEIDFPKDVKRIYDLLKTEEQKRQYVLLSLDELGPFHRMIYAPPSTPENVVKVLRKSIWAMLHDPTFMADVERLRGDDPLDIRPGEKMEEIIRTALGKTQELKVLMQKHAPKCPFNDNFK